MITKLCYYSITLIMMSFLLSCSTHYKRYDGPEMQDSKISILEGNASEKVYIRNVDSKGSDSIMPFYGGKWNGGYKIDLEPGTHEISVYYRSGNKMSSYDKHITHNFRPGHKYTVRGAHIGNDGWKAWIEETK